MRVNFGREGASLVLWACSRVGRGRDRVAEHVSDEITLCAAAVGLCAEILVPAQASQRSYQASALQTREQSCVSSDVRTRTRPRICIPPGFPRLTRICERCYTAFQGSRFTA